MKNAAQPHCRGLDAWLRASAPLVVPWLLLAAGCGQEPSTDAPATVRVAQTAEDTTVTPRMLRIGAEAADGYHGRGSVHVAVTFEPDLIPIVGATRQEVEDSVRAQGGGAYIGVFNTPERLTAPDVRRVERVVVYFVDDETPWEVPVNEIDLIAWRMSAIEKFVLPYYLQTRGAEFARGLEQSYHENTTELFCHRFDSFYCDEDEVGREQ